MAVSAESTTYAYIDQSGDPSLEIHKQGVSEYYVVTATITDDSSQQAHQEEAEQIISAHFGPGEMKSSSVGSDVTRREKILSDIANSGIRFYSLVINKRQVLPASGLQYKRSFYKFLNNLVFKQLVRGFASLQIIADNIGGSAFMEGFKRYVNATFKESLFEKLRFDFADSRDHPLVQISDFIAGTISRVYSGADSDDLLKLIGGNTILIEEWPPNVDRPHYYEALEHSTKHDLLVREQAVARARAFVEGNADSNDPYIRAQVGLVQYLLYHYKVIDPSTYVSTDELRRHIGEAVGFDGSEQVFRSRVVASLRDQGVIIASSAKGYKIPYDCRDMQNYVALVSGQVVPHLERLAKVRNQFMLASKEDYDIVSPAQFPHLKAYIEQGKDA